MRKDDVAIIGAAGIFPGAADLAAFHTNLRSGRESVGMPGADRMRSSDDDPDVPYLAMGYLDRIDLFDHELFGLPRREAELMEPHQRLLALLTHQAIESAGYAPAALRGTDAAVLLAAIDPGAAAGGERDVESILGTSTAALAARLSYLFDLQGPALVVDTACSSGLSALGLAVGKLRAREVPLAVVGGVNLFPRLIRRADWIPMQGLESGDQHCRPFDAAADGLVAGEGGGIVLLKPLTDAVTDGDNVLAVLKGIAVNHNGFRAASMAAPSQLGQAKVMTDAWRDGQVDAGTIGYIECHGSGTPLGDVVEVEALRRAFAESGVTGRQCAISSVKANIGHLGNSAGIAGLFKVMSALRHGTHYPAANFSTPNPLIDFGGPVYVSTDDRPWQPENTPRRAGLSSWGLTGTNVHAVLEQPPAASRQPVSASGAEPLAERDAATATGQCTELVTVSAAALSALDRYRGLVAAFAERTDQPLRSVAHALNRGRDDHPYRIAVTAADTGELAARLRAATLPEEAAADAPRPVLLFSGDALIDDEVWARLCTDFPVPAECQGPETGSLGPAATLVVRQYGLCHVAESLGLTDVSLIGTGAGNLAVRAARGRITLAAAVAEAAGHRLTAELDRSRLERVVAGFVRDGAVAVVLGDGGVLAREIAALAPGLPVVGLAADGSRSGVLERLGRLYALGAPLDWDRHYRDNPPPRIEAPTYPFEPTRCRLPARPRPGEGPTEGAATAQPAVAPSDRAATESRVAAIWTELLEEPDIGPDADYFMLGGTSLVGVGLLRRLQQHFGVEVTFSDLYTYRTVRGLATRLLELAASAEEDGTATADEPITPLPPDRPMPLSFGQEPLWYLDQVNPGSPLYNVPVLVHLRGPLDEEAMQDALADMAVRHKGLRSLFLTDDGGSPYVTYTAPEPLMASVNVSRIPVEQRPGRVQDLILDTISAPFDLTRDTPYRALLIKLAEEEHVLALTLHHIVYDGGSTQLFSRDLSAFYRARTTGEDPGLPELPAQYQDFAAWHRSALSGPRLERGLEFWRDQLDGLSRPELPLDRPRPEVQEYEGGQVAFTVEAEVAERLREYSRRNGVTTFVAMLAVLDGLIHLWSGHDDVVIGVATSGRIHPDVQDLVGYFNSLPPFRTRGISEDISFDSLVRRCADTVAGVLDHEEIPLNKIISAGNMPRDLARHPLYDVTYTYQNVPQYQGGMVGLDVGRYWGTDIGGVVPGTAKFDLSFSLVDSGSGAMIGEVEYAASLFDHATAEHLARWFPALATAAVTEPGTAIGRLPRPEGQARRVERPTAESVPSAPAGTAALPATGTASGAPETVLAAAAAPVASGPGGEAAAPSEGAQSVLRRLFGELVGAERVGPEDDFFALGGDSVMSIQLVARARRAGVVITQRQLFQLKTPAALAAVATGPATAAASAPAQDTPRGGTDRTTAHRTATDRTTVDRVPLTPVMRDFAERAGMPGRFTQSVVVAVPAGLDRETLTAAARAVAAHHEMLRARLVREDAEDPASWALEVAAPETGGTAPESATEVRRVDATGLGPEALAALTERKSGEAAGQLAPDTADMTRYVWLDRGAEEEGRLLIAVHHLVVDVLSWQVLLPDLAAACAALASGSPVSLPPVPTSFGRWARELAAQAEDSSLKAQLPVWEAVLAPGEPQFGGRPLDPDRDTVGKGQRVRVQVPAEVTDELLTAVPAVFYTGTGDVLLAALTTAVAEWRAARGTGAGPVVIDVEGHGREPLDGEMDLSRTVGWFTSSYPVRLDPGDIDFAEVRAGGPSAGHVVKRVREQLGTIPGNGLGYGLLRHLAPEAGAALAGLPGASVGFNYLGTLSGTGPVAAPGGNGATGHDAAGHDAADGWRLLETGGDLEETTFLGHALEAMGAVHEGSEGRTLELLLWGSGELFEESELAELCESWAAVLTGLAAHAARPDAGGHVPSDFPLVSLSQAEVEELERRVSE
ncbi:condensation domain-containing protein [Streptomyces daliensis]